MADKVPMTVKGKQLLDEELAQLIKVERPSVVKAIEEARAHGDLSENADYDAAKERQALVEGRISEIQGKLAMAEVIDQTQISSEKIVFGATVTLEDFDTEKQVTYMLVGVDQADVKQGLISVFSPLGKAMIGKKKGDIIELSSPKGDKEFEVLSFEYK